jgi:hypothetical protein
MTDLYGRASEVGTSAQTHLSCRPSSRSAWRLKQCLQEWIVVNMHDNGHRGDPLADRWAQTA